MRVFLFRELRVGFGKKLVAVLLLTLVFSFSFSAYHSFTYSQRLSDMQEMRVMEAENQLMTEESNAWAYESMGGAELVALMQEKTVCLQGILDGYKSGDMVQVLENQVKINEIEQNAKAFGLQVDAYEEKEMAEQSGLYRFLLENQIAPYDPLLEPHDGVSSVFYFLKTIMLFLVPLAVMLVGADTLSGEMQFGSIKLSLMFPRSRLAVLVTKYFSVVLLSLLVIFGSLVGAFAGGSVFSGTGDFRYPLKAQASFFTGGEEVYTASWVLLIRAMGVLICAVLFFAALALLVSALFRNVFVSVAVGAFASTGAVLLNREVVTAGNGGVARYLPFDLSDSYAAAIGKIVVPIQEKVVGTSGLIATQDTGRIIELMNPFPGIVPCVVLLVSAVLFFFIAAAVFSRRDVA